MGKFVYRMCLAVILMIAVAGGVYYYMTFYQEEEIPEKGTFVQETNEQGIGSEWKEFAA